MPNFTENYAAHVGERRRSKSDNGGIYVCLMMGEGVLVGIPTPKRLLPLMMGVREVEDGVLSRVSELKTTVVGGGGGRGR